MSLKVPSGIVSLRDIDVNPPNSSPGESSLPNSAGSAGTVVIRDDVPSTHINPFTPGPKKKNAVKDIFSPMALERMFEPPSPPIAPVTHNPSLSAQPNAPFQPSRLSQVHVAPSTTSADNSNLYGSEQDEIVATDLPNMVSFDGRKPSLNCQFTFAVARQTPNTPHLITPSGLPQAESTPIPTHRPSNLAVPPTDPRLRLFQFQYDTFTRDHLSAMVDSIAINSPSISNPDHLPSPYGQSPVTESSTAGGSTDLRSAKRVKLSPNSDVSTNTSGVGVLVQQPQRRTDWVGESKSLMAQIKEGARNFSTASTVATHKPPSRSPEGQAHDRLPSSTRHQYSRE